MTATCFLWIVVQSLSCVWHFCDPVDTPGFPVLGCLLRFAQTHVCWVSEAIQPSYPLSPSSPLALSLFQYHRFSSESALHIQWPKYWNSASSSSEYSGLISFRIDWLNLLAVQGTLKSLLQYHSSKASILRHSAFFIVQLSHSYMTTGKTIDFPGGLDGKASAYNAGDLGLIPGSEDPLEKEMAIHSSIRAWKVPWTEEPGRLQSMGSQRVGHDWATSLSLFIEREGERDKDINCICFQ